MLNPELNSTLNPTALLGMGDPFRLRENAKLERTLAISRKCNTRFRTLTAHQPTPRVADHW
jgi:hypothetical protein